LNANSRIALHKIKRVGIALSVQ